MAPGQPGAHHHQVACKADARLDVNLHKGSGNDCKWLACSWEHEVDAQLLCASWSSEASHLKQGSCW